MKKPSEKIVTVTSISAIESNKIWFILEQKRLMPPKRRIAASAIGESSFNQSGAEKTNHKCN